MKLSLLDYTQNILSALSSDEVNSISDSPESLQVAEIVKTSYFNIISRAELPDQRIPFQLDASLSITEPNLMFIPQNIRSIEWIKYFDTAASGMYKYVTILPLQQFSDYVDGYNSSDMNVDTLSLVTNNETFTFNYKDDIQPRFCTVISNFYVVFDSFDNTVDSTLQASKTMCYGLSSPIFKMEDSFIPELDDAQVPLLLNEAKSLAFFELKQTLHSKAEQEAKRQWNSLQKDKSFDNKPSSFDQLANFGRVTPYRHRPFFRW